MEQERNFLQS
jgi:hypothetical protein